MNKILVCTDGSQYSQVACQYAAWLAKMENASITALYVTDLRLFEVPAVADLSGSMGIQPFEGMVAQLQEVEKVKAKFVDEQATSIFQEEGLADQAEFKHETGLLVDVVKDMADSYDLIVLGKRGENANFASEHLGSMLERVVRAVDKPCFVNNREFSEIKQIAIAYDGSESCQKAIEYFVAQQSFHKMHFHVLSSVEGHDEDLASQRLTEVESRFKAVGIDATYQSLNGVVEAAITEYVEDNRIDLLVLGAYGHSRIRELLIGSTTTELLRRCHVPVFCFR
ncbi:universal stress protein [Coraliomargarita sinensis]|uniref:Universal stress protein n=1 Tax=Coraliomargarita sinensis TaxID=2174842 RepID=A0A317ZLN2_9BACT|nr:universal stress protein [Coraliomargarita sinensis]PXA04729.1 universal stress protein [Coraliomargarita sinensis]